MTRRDRLLGSAAMPPDMGFIFQVLNSLLETDDSISGFTLIQPNGAVRFIDAELLRRGGEA